MDRKVTYYLDGKGRVFLHYIWDGDALGAFKSGFFPKDMNVEIIPKEENISGENLLMVEYLPGRKILLRVGDGILRSYEWKGVKKMYRDKNYTKQNTFFQQKNWKKINNPVKIEKIIAIREKGKTKVKPGMIRVTEYRPKFVSLKQRVENENKDLEF